MKTATIIVHEVFGTNGRTIAANVFYRGKRLWHVMENETAQNLLNRARAWAYDNGFSHVRLEV